MPEIATDTRMPMNSFLANPCIRGKKNTAPSIVPGTENDRPKNGRNIS